MSVLAILIISVFCVNIVCILTMIFVERKKPHTIVSWFIVLNFLPIIGFLIYGIVGSGLSYKTKKMLKKKRLYAKSYEDFVKEQKQLFTSRNISKEELKYLDLMLFNLNNSNSSYLKNNSVRVFLNGEDKILALKKDLLRAKHSINILYYIFADDEVGREVMDILIQKAKEGVKVKLLFDSVGCLKTPRKFFKQLVAAGGEIAEFFPLLFGFRLFNFKANYRNHKKIVVIDGRIGYTGGINIRDDHMGKSRRLSPWRDTHIRIVGNAVHDLQIAFFNDWRYCKNISSSMNSLISEGYFPRLGNFGDVGCQVITSGPDLPNQPIKESLLKMILSAKDKIYIQTPYFIPDESMLSALKIAKMSGVDIKIMIPSKPDKKFVYAATLSFVKDLIPTGIEFYRYDGFLHAKSIIIDDKVVSIGSCNFDNRSFALNFEISAFLFNAEFVDQNLNYFLVDLSHCAKVENSFFKRKFIFNKFSQVFVRLFAPLL